MTLQVTNLEEKEREIWDQAVESFAYAHPLNVYGWGKVRAIDGWEASYLVAKDGEVIKGMIMVLAKRIPWTGLTIMYAPKGPLHAPEDRDTLNTLMQSVTEEGRRRRAIFLRMDPNIPEDYFGKRRDPFVDEGFIHLENRWSFWNSPRDVYRIDLTGFSSYEELFNSIDRDARRCVRKAQKEGVTVRPAVTLEELHRFYEIFSQFSVRKGFMCRKLKYQETLWNEYIAQGKGRLFLAVYDGEIIGGLICILFGGKCLAMHMGTPLQYSRLQTNYAYVWESIRWAWERGCSWYSFRGVGTTPTQESFKRKFNPRVVALVGYYDLPFRPLLYKAFYGIENAVLPRVWRKLMRARDGYTRIANRTRRKKTLSPPFDKSVNI